MGISTLKARWIQWETTLQLKEQCKLPVLTFPSFDDAREIKCLAATNTGALFIVNQL